MSYTKRLVVEWAANTPGVTKVEGILDTPEKIREYIEKMRQVHKHFRQPGRLPRK